MIFNTFKTFQEKQELKIKEIKKQELILNITGLVATGSTFFIQIEPLPIKLFISLLCFSIFLMLNILLKKISFFNYKKWYDEESKTMIQQVVSKAWENQDYEELKFILNKFPLKTLFMMFIQNPGLAWDKSRLMYQHLDSSISFLQNNPCDFSHLDSSEYTLEYIRVVLPELSTN